MHGFDKSASNLGVDQIDLLILHQALPSALDMSAIDALDTGQRGGPEPTDITLERFGRPIPDA